MGAQGGILNEVLLGADIRQYDAVKVLGIKKPTLAKASVFLIW